MIGIELARRSSDHAHSWASGCPGTVAAEIGEGRLDALVAGVSGLTVGALLFGLMQPLIMPSLSAVGALGHVSVASLTGANPGLVLVVFVQIVVLVSMLMDRGSSGL